MIFTSIWDNLEWNAKSVWEQYKRTRGQIKISIVTLNVPPTLYMNCAELVKLRRNDDDDDKWDGEMWF